MAKVFLWILLSVVPSVIGVYYHIQLLHGCWGLNGIFLEWLQIQRETLSQKIEQKRAVAIVQE